MPLLSDELLLEAYRHALRLKLEQEFLSLLRAEIDRRKLVLPEEQPA
ncbi:MAG: sporulation histidine kinase inhibitor Sda [Cohnella sp.]|nr:MULTISPECIES: sporulation histidine kinase inhibitor Sda [Cohnella]REK60545.1 MAG: sporulation histidine kinase inhibitor Sda [Cohnella sp.]